MKKLILTSILALTAGISSGHAGLIFSDTFNTADDTDINLNLATRQSGSVSTQTWATSGDNNAQITSGKLNLPTGGFSDSSAYVNYDFSSAPGLLAGGEFTIAFDLTANTNYSGFFLGTTSESSGFDLENRPVISPTSDFGMLIKSAGGSAFYVNGSSTGTASVGGGEKNYVFSVQTTDFNSGTPFTVSLTLDGSPYDLNGAAAGTATTGAWDSGSTLYMGFTTRNNQTLVDNVVVSNAVVIPEVSTPILLVISLGTLMLFKRKTRIPATD